MDHPGEAVREARIAYNRAILARDPDAIASHLADDYRLVTSLGEAVDGRAAALSRWQARFAGDPDVWYERTLVSVHVNGDAAEERGTWEGHYSWIGKRVSGAGVYAAEWRRDADGAWRVVSEVFNSGPRSQG